MVLIKASSDRPAGESKVSNKTRFLLILMFIVQLLVLFTNNFFATPCAKSGVKSVEAKSSSVFDPFARFMTIGSSSTSSLSTASSSPPPDKEKSYAIKKPTIHYSDEDLQGVKPRVFSYKHKFPCHKPEEHWYLTNVQRSPARVGILFMKEMKTGSSTMAGVTLRMAKSVAAQTDYKICKARFDHSMASDLEYGKRDKAQSFLWTVLRNPTKRATSQFFHFKVSREKEEPSDLNFKNYMDHPVFHQYYLKSLSTTPLRKNDDLIEVANEIMKEYDFIGITERMDESLVVLSMILDLPLDHVLYLSAKGNGGFDDGRFQEKCVYIVPPYISPTMKEYFESEKWKEATMGDEQLYRAAWRSLDMTIDSLGRDTFEKQLGLFKEFRKMAENFCADKVQYPCNSDGSRLITAPGCLWNDSGCGHQCLDQVSAMWDEKQMNEAQD